MKLIDKILALPIHKIPKQYGWHDRQGIDLEDLGFSNLCDCLNKRYARECGKFPQDFDATLLYRIFNKHLKHKWLHTFINIDPATFILSQKYVKKNRLLELIDDPNNNPIRCVQVGKYTIIHDGHHRLALKHLRNSKIYAKIKIYTYDN